MMYQMGWLIPKPVQSAPSNCSSIIKIEIGSKWMDCLPLVEFYKHFVCLCVRVMICAELIDNQGFFFFLATPADAAIFCSILWWSTKCPRAYIKRAVNALQECLWKDPPQCPTFFFPSGNLSERRQGNQSGGGALGSHSRSLLLSGNDGQICPMLRSSHNLQHSFSRSSFVVGKGCFQPFGSLWKALCMFRDRARLLASKSIPAGWSSQAAYPMRFQLQIRKKKGKNAKTFLLTEREL